MSVSSGVGEVAGSLVGSVVGSPEAVARTSGPSADGAAGSAGDVAGLLSNTGVCVVSIVLGSEAPSSRIPDLSVVPLKMAPLVKEVKASWPTSTHECISPKDAVHQALAGWSFWPNTVGPEHMPGSSGAVLPCNLGRVSYDLESARMPSYQCISGQVVKSSHCRL